MRPGTIKIYTPDESMVINNAFGSVVANEGADNEETEKKLMYYLEEITISEYNTL